MIEIQQTLLHIGMDLNGTRDEFGAELKEPQPHLETLEQLIEDFRETLDVLDNQAPGCYASRCSAWKRNWTQ